MYLRGSIPSPATDAAAIVNVLRIEGKEMGTCEVERPRPWLDVGARRKGQAAKTGLDRTLASWPLVSPSHAVPDLASDLDLLLLLSSAA
jgi:hypothetical protein